MKVLTKHVVIMDREFFLISDKTKDDEIYYGTIPYTEVTEDGHLKRQLNGFEMCVSLVSIGDALQERENRIKTEIFEAKGHTKAEVMAFICNDYKEEGIDADLVKRLAAIC